MVTQKDIKDFITSWTDDLLKIQKEYLCNHDYKKSARSFIDKHYLFNDEPVLFKPTMTNKTIFRNDTESALSYFIGGNLPEDNGFALQDFRKINIEEIYTIIEDELLAVMGIFNFESNKPNENSRVAFTFVLKETNLGLKIKIHHSSLIT